MFTCSVVLQQPCGRHRTTQSEDMTESTNTEVVIAMVVTAVPTSPRGQISSPLSLKLEGRYRGNQDMSTTHLHNDIHGIVVFLLALSKGSHIEGAEPQGQDIMEDKGEEQQGGQAQESWV